MHMAMPAPIKLLGLVEKKVHKSHYLRGCNNDGHANFPKVCVLGTLCTVGHKHRHINSMQGISNDANFTSAGLMSELALMSF